MADHTRRDLRDIIRIRPYGTCRRDAMRSAGASRRDGIRQDIRQIIRALLPVVADQAATPTPASFPPGRRRTAFRRRERSPTAHLSRVRASRSSCSWRQ